MINKIIGAVLLLASGWTYTVERVANVFGTQWGTRIHNVNAFTVIFAIVGGLLLIVGLFQSKRQSSP